MRPFYVGLILFIGCSSIVTLAEQDVKQIKLEDIEKDNLQNESNDEVLQTEQTQSLKQSEDGVEEKGESKEPSQTDIRYAQLPYDEGPVDIQYVTPSAPSAPYADYDNEPKNFVQQYQYVPQVHESDLTYTVPARQSLLKPTIGGGAPIHSLLMPQPQYVYVTSHGSASKASAAAQPAKTLYQQEQQTQQQQQQHYHSLYAPSAPEQQYLPFPYPYQQLSKQHIVSPPVAPPLVSVPSPAVYSLSHGNTGLEPYQSSNVRPYVYDAPSYSPTKQVLPLSFSPYKNHHTPKYHTTIEPQLILGPFSLPPTIEYNRPYQPPHPYPHYDLNFIPSHSGRPFSPLKFKVTQNYGHSTPSHAYGLPSYNTIAYSVPYSPKYKRDSNH